MRKNTYLAMAVLIGAVGAGCTSDGRSEAKQVGATPAVRAHLENLGYEPWVAEKRPPKRTGVIAHDPAEAADGYVLYASRGACSAHLIDREGEIVHRWAGALRGYWSDTELLPDGTLLVVGASSGARETQHQSRYLRRLAWDSTVLWESDFPAHHDVESLADGRLLTLSSATRVIDDGGVSRRIIDEQIVLAGADGKLQEAYSLFDAFAATPGIAPAGLDRRTVPMDGTHALDAFHANSVEWIDLPQFAGQHPLYQTGNVLVSMRHQNRIAVLDRVAKRLLWVWGDGVLDGQHSARMLANGNILVFDNALRTRRSRVLEVDPRTNQVVTEFSGDESFYFYTLGGGASQRLPNGNTLVTETSKGHLFEVTPRGDLVWRFVNPVQDPQSPRRATIHASKWLPATYVVPILAKNAVESAQNVLAGDVR